MNTDGRSRHGEPPEDTPKVWQLRLYVVGGARNSVQALSHLRTILDRHVPNGYRLEIVDILDDPRRALTDGILLTPTLIKSAPLPIARLIGSLSETERVVSSLGLPPPPLEPGAQAETAR